ncbi:MAG TPA: DUF1223 domain-containing protein [Caulobacteraceae bacterium]|nr:DUF1223 domain-containing protein [Caulobacteraceae bacterium]
MLMRPPLLGPALGLAALAAGVVGLAALTGVQGAKASDAAHPAVVELFQSQGCSSCPPANANLIALSQRPDVLALSFGVTYWDQLGWKDTFASPQYTARQWDYAHALRHDNVFTPQVVVNGRVDGVGAQPGEIEALMRRAERTAPGPAVTIGASDVVVGAAPAPARSADVWLVRYDPRIVQVAIRRGENGGRTLPHRNVVRELVRLGGWSGPAARFSLPPSRDPALRAAVLVQTAGAGPILAATKG